MAEEQKPQTAGGLTPRAWEKIEAAVRDIGYGSITLIVQDGKAIQIEINEKIRLPDQGGTMTDKTKRASCRTEGLRAEIGGALGGLQYGQVVILIKDGRVTQIERTEKRRLPRLEGIDGEGI